MKAFSFLFFLLIPVLIFAQSNVNPDISLIGTFNTSTDLDKGFPRKRQAEFRTA